MEIKKGIAVSPGITIAKLLVIDSEDYRIPRREINPSQRIVEIQRIRNAFKDASEELSRLEAEHDKAEGSKIKDIFAVHLRFLRDRSLRKKITDLVHAESVSAEYAVSSSVSCSIPATTTSSDTPGSASRCLATSSIWTK